jgi:Mce-associated membrane protein
MPLTRRLLTAPWITAAVAALVLVALLLVYFIALRPDQGHVAGDLTSDERAAISAASTEAANVLSYRRAHFDADFQRAVDGATGSLKSDLTAQKAATQSTITQGKFDMSATVSLAAVEGRPDTAKGDSYQVLVTLNGYRSDAKDQATPSQLELTVQKVKSKWLVSDIASIGLTS